MRVLIAYSMSSAHASTTYDYLMALKRHTGVDVSYLHVSHDARLDIDLGQYDVVLNNYCARLVFVDYVTESWRAKLRVFTGLKILSVQDEYDNTNLLREAISDLGFDIVLTSSPVSSHDWIFNPKANPTVTYMNMPSGFAPEPETLAGINVHPLKKRRIALGYRGRNIGPRYGSLGYLKYEAGRRMAQSAKKRRIKYDIAMDEDSRLYGSAWYDFIANCRAMIGTESGSNVVDFDGSIAAEFLALEAIHGRPLPYAPYLPLVAEAETHVNMSEASPRLFECAALFTPLILIKGYYSGIVTPGEHYIALERDFSNIDAVFDQLADVSALQAMAIRTNDHLIKSGRHCHAKFARELEALMVARVGKKAHTNNLEHVADPHDPTRERPTATPNFGFTFQIWLWRKSSLKVATDIVDPIGQYQAQIEENRAILSDAKALYPWLFVKSAKLTAPARQFSDALAAYHRADTQLAGFSNISAQVSHQAKLGLHVDHGAHIQVAATNLSVQLESYLTKNPVSMWHPMTRWKLALAQNDGRWQPIIRRAFEKVPLVARLTNQLN